MVGFHLWGLLKVPTSLKDEFVITTAERCPLVMGKSGNCYTDTEMPEVTSSLPCSPWFLQLAPIVAIFSKVVNLTVEHLSVVKSLIPPETMRLFLPFPTMQNMPTWKAVF